MRKLLRRYLPSAEQIRENRWLAMFGQTLTHPRLWHLNRHSAAGGVAIGMFCGLIPGPLQMLGATVGCLIFRVNLPLALLCTLYTNPLTIAPLYFAAFAMGNWVLGQDPGELTPPPEWDGSVSAWLAQTLDWMSGLGQPLAIGLVLLASSLSALGYLVVWGMWRWNLVRSLRERRRQYPKS